MDSNRKEAERKRPRRPVGDPSGRERIAVEQADA